MACWWTDPAGGSFATSNPEELVQLIIRPDGQVRTLYDEAIDLNALGSSVIMRASNVEPDDQGRWWADLGPVHGPRLGPFTFRSEALLAERLWLEDHWLSPKES
jgi:hypothetical protein